MYAWLTASVHSVSRISAQNRIEPGPDPASAHIRTSVNRTGRTVLAHAQKANVITVNKHFLHIGSFDDVIKLFERFKVRLWPGERLDWTLERQCVGQVLPRGSKVTFLHRVLSSNQMSLSEVAARVGYETEASVGRASNATSARHRPRIGNTG